MPTFLVTPTSRRAPAIRVTATDLIDLGEQVAVHLTRHRHLTRGVPYDAQIGADRGAITQAGMRVPVTFTITQEQA